VKDQFGRARSVTYADVVPEAGKAARMRKSNIFAGKVGARCRMGTVHLL
jgi:hypothetical protein